MLVAVARSFPSRLCFTGLHERGLLAMPQPILNHAAPEMLGVRPHRLKLLTRCVHALGPRLESSRPRHPPGVVGQLDHSIIGHVLEHRPRLLTVHHHMTVPFARSASVL